MPWNCISMTSGVATDHIRQHWGIPYHMWYYFPFCTWIVARGDSHQTNPEVAYIHWFTTPICVCDVTGLMNIQGGIQDFTHNPQRLQIQVVG